MVKVLFLGLLVAMMCGLVSAVPAPQLARSIRPEVFPSSPTIPSSPVLEDPATRSERSTNLSYITGTARKIQLFIKNRHLQLLSDGTVNGTTNASSAYTVFQRMTIGISKMKIQGVASCRYLCMDSCGLLYGSEEFGEECIFNEIIEPDHYNTYSSAKYSNERRTFYLALNRRGHPRKVLLRALQPLGRLSSYVRVLVRTISVDKYKKLYSIYNCPPNIRINTRSPEIDQESAKEQFRCRRRKKRKKSKKNCIQTKWETCYTKKMPKKRKRLHFKFRKKCLVAGSSECRVAISVGKRKKKQISRGAKQKKLQADTVTEYAAETDQDYTVESTTRWDWDYSTATTEEFSTSYTD